MKTLLGMFAVLCGLSNLVCAEPLTFDFGKNSLVLPLQIVSGTQMYSFDEQRGFTGAETTVFKRGDFDLTVGAATGYGSGIQFPFVAGQIKLPARFFDTSNNDLRFGIWAGRDYDANENKWGIKGSVQLW